MEVRTLSVTTSLTVNVGNYQSVKVQAGIEAELAPGDDEQECWKQLWDKVDEQAVEHAADASRAFKNNPDLGGR